MARDLALLGVALRAVFKIPRCSAYALRVRKKPCWAGVALGGTGLWPLRDAPPRPGLIGVVVSRGCGSGAEDGEIAKVVSMESAV